MRIEKINSNQIKCVLDKEELLKRHINVSELAYGSDKAQELFKDMMQQASFEFGFESGSAPLMIEAVPLSSDGIMLIITKVDNPEELDDKYSGLSFPSARTFKKKEEEEETIDLDLDPEDEHDDHTEPLLEEELAPVPENTISAFFVYSFGKLDDISDATRSLTFFPSEGSRVYKNMNEGKYILSIQTDAVTKADCKVIRGTLSEYGEAIQCRKSKLNYFDEHYDIIVKDDAVKKMSVL
jgi:adapter protein MecA 1/2